MFYKARLVMTEEGMQVQFQEFNCIHETECYAYCINSWSSVPSPLKHEGETELQAAKRMKIKIFRIHKASSRIAFKTKELAFNQLVFLKRRQINHMKRDIDLFSYFLDRTADSGLSALKQEFYPYKLQGGDIHTLPESTEKLSQYYVFD